MRFAFYVSENATRLKKFLNIFRERPEIRNIEFILIDNVDNDELRRICRNLDIKFYEVSLVGRPNANRFISDIFLKYLMEGDIDTAFVFANRILQGDLLEVYKNRLINFHPSVLPSYKGRNAIDQALSDNALILGNTAHTITSILDGGIIIMQNFFVAAAFKNYDDVLDKQLPMLLQLMMWINDERLIIDNGRAKVIGANYDFNEFIPNLEFIVNKFEIPLGNM